MQIYTHHLVIGLFLTYLHKIQIVLSQIYILLFYKKVTLIMEKLKNWLKVPAVHKPIHIL